MRCFSFSSPTAIKEVFLLKQTPHACFLQSCKTAPIKALAVVMRAKVGAMPADYETLSTADSMGVHASCVRARSSINDQLGHQLSRVVE
jgi:hypothetical protein